MQPEERPACVPEAVDARLEGFWQMLAADHRVEGLWHIHGAGHEMVRAVGSAVLELYSGRATSLDGYPRHMRLIQEGAPISNEGFHQAAGEIEAAADADLVSGVQIES